MNNKFLIVQVAGLGYEFIRENCGNRLAGLEFRATRSVFPAVTCSVQASFRTGLAASGHGMVSNGLWDREFVKARFWEQSSALVQGRRIWEEFRNSGKKVAMLFWQQSMGEKVDIVLTPAPIHKHHGGMIQDCYCQPAGLYHKICEEIGRKFNLMNYWGPLASWKSSQWIAEATAVVMEDAELAPDLVFTYLPVLDYDLQRFGPRHPKAAKTLRALEVQLELLRASAAVGGYEMLVFGDYALEEVAGRPVLPNLALRQRGLLAVRDVHGMEYPDFFRSVAFVMVDHAIGHVFVRDTSRLDEVQECLQRLDGVAEVLDRDQQKRYEINHPRSGDFVIVAERGRWLAYPWWENKKRAPDYASHVDIHNKPGYDPAELFFGWPPGSISLHPERVRGTHGGIGAGLEVAWGSTFIDGDCANLLELASALEKRLAHEI